MAKAIIIGAYSGIGRALAQVFAEQGYEVGLVARRFELLKELQQQLPTKSFIKQIDITHTSAAIAQLQSLIQEMTDVDVCVINSGIWLNNPECDWDKDRKTIEVNVVGFSAMANVALNYFLTKGHGHLVGISSVSACRGENYTPAYSASKAFVSNYLEGIRHRMAQENKKIFITDIQPGWVDTNMAKGQETFWMASARNAAVEIYSAIHKKRPHAYITSRWRLYAWLLKISPKWFYDRFL